MGCLDVEAMLARLGREEFQRWLVAYHELHLEGGWQPAAEIAATIHNEVAPLLAAWAGLEFTPHSRDDYLPRVLFGSHGDGDDGDGDEKTRQAEQDAAIDAIVGQAERIYGS